MADNKVKGVVDLVILLDVSGSMQECINAVKSSVDSFIGSLSAKDANNDSPVKDWRIKVCGYRDHGVDPANWFVDNPFVRDIPSVQAQLNAPNLNASGGGDEPESLLDALYKLAKMEASTPQDSQPESPDKWRPRSSATRIVVFFTDATFKTPMTIPEAAGGGVGDVVTQLMNARIIPVGFVPEWPGYEELGACERAEITTYIKKADSPAIGNLGAPGEPGNAAMRAAVAALKALSKDSEGFTKLMAQLAKTVQKSSAEPPPEAC